MWDNTFPPCIFLLAKIMHCPVDPLSLSNNMSNYQSHKIQSSLWFPLSQNSSYKGFQMITGLLTGFLSAKFWCSILNEQWYGCLKGVAHIFTVFISYPWTTIIYFLCSLLWDQFSLMMRIFQDVVISFRFSPKGDIRSIANKVLKSVI